MRRTSLDSSKVLHRAMVSAMVAAVVVMGLVMVGCGGAQIAFAPPPPSVAWPIEWQGDIALEQIYPKPARPFEKDKALAGEAFLVEYARVTPELLLGLRDFVLVGSSGVGRFNVNRYQLAPLASSEATNVHELYRLTITLAGPDSTGTLQLGLDHRLRLWSYEARLYPQRGGVVQSVIRSIARYEESGAGGAGYKMAGELGEIFVKSDEPRVPEELIPLLPILGPNKAVECNFLTVSVAFRGVYSTEMAVRPEGRGKPEALNKIASRSPMGREWQVVVDYSKRSAIRWASDASGVKWHPGVLADLESAEALVNTIRRERGGNLLFNGERVFSGWRPDGARIDLNSLAGQSPDNDSWLSIDASPLGLTVDAMGRAPTELLNMTDEANAQVSMGGRGMLREGERRLEIEVDFLPSQVDLNTAAERLITAFLAAGQKLEVARSDLTINGKPAVRIDLLETITNRTRTGVSTATIFHSFLLIADGQAVLRLEFTMGPGWSKWITELEETCQRVRFSAPRVIE